MVRIFILASLIFFHVSANADILFEGYSKVLINEKPIGYIVNRYEFLPNKNQFVSTYFLKTSAPGVELLETYKAVADKDLAPVSYNYTSLLNKDSKSIDAEIKKGKMNGTIIENGKKKTVKNDLKPKEFLSTFLIYWILKSEKGLVAGESYPYKAIAEEDGVLAEGITVIKKKQETYAGLPVYKAMNDFKGQKFEAYVTERGEIVQTFVPANGVTTELVATRAEAVGPFSFSEPLIKKLFGNIPEGKENVLAKKSVSDAASTGAPGKTESPSGKQEGVAPGKGLQIKNQGEGQ